jgi:hypothetical protein
MTPWCSTGVPSLETLLTEGIGSRLTKHVSRTYSDLPITVRLPSQDVVAHVIDEAVSTLAEASQQLLGGALGTRRPDAVARITTQLAQCGVPTALAAALALPLFATGAMSLGVGGFHASNSTILIPCCLQASCGRTTKHRGVAWWQLPADVHMKLLCMRC